VSASLAPAPGLQNFTRFSAWFGNYSHSNKQQRLLAELSCAMAAGDTGATCSRSSVRMDYLPALRQVGSPQFQLVWCGLGLVLQHWVGASLGFVQSNGGVFLASMLTSALQLGTPCLRLLMTAGGLAMQERVHKRQAGPAWASAFKGRWPTCRKTWVYPRNVSVTHALWHATRGRATLL
jgi:hypothetical protein